MEFEYLCNNCRVDFPDVNAFFAHAYDCKLKYHNKARYQRVAKKEASLPNRFHKKTRDTIYQFLVDLWGEHCIHCKEPPSRAGPLDVDHADNDPTNWNPENLRLACETCNLFFRGLSTEEHVRQIQVDSDQNERGGGNTRDKSSTDLIKNLVDYSSGSVEMQANKFLETRFRNWILKVVDEKKIITRNDAVAGGAEYSGCAIRTAEKYLAKMTSITGPLQEHKTELNQVIISRRQKHA